MSVLSRRRDPLALRHTLGQRLWLTAHVYPRAALAVVAVVTLCLLAAAAVVAS